MTAGTRIGRRRGQALAAALVAASVAAILTGGRVEGQTFRSAVDLIALEVQVRDKGGKPIDQLDIKSFEVTIDGKQRRVVSADMIRPDTGNGPAERGQVVFTADRVGTTTPGRTFVIAIDAGSFRTLDSHVAVLAAQRFIDGLLPNDQVSIVTVPTGPKLMSSTDHAAARRLVGTVVGSRPEMKGQFEFSTAEIIDITGALASKSLDQLRMESLGTPEQAQRTPMRSDNDVVASEVIQRHCATESAPQSCFDRVLVEVEQEALVLEQNALRGIGGLDSLLQVLQGTPERKTVLLLSGGMPTSDRGNGRPTVGNALKKIGEQAAYANATVNVIMFDRTADVAFSTETESSHFSTVRGRSINSRALTEFSEPSGGLLLISDTGSAEGEVDRMLARSAAYYLLGVEPDNKDRDGRPHKVQVKVRQKDADVKSRQLVIVPKPRS